MAFAATGNRFVRMAALVVLVFAFAGIGLAYFTAAGQGSGSATAATPTPIVAAPATASAGLYPGGSGEVAVTLSNANPAPLHIASLVVDTTRGSGGFAVDAGHATACTSPSLSFTVQSNGGAGWDVPAAVGPTAGTLTLHLSGALQMGTSASAGCQGGSFTVYLQAGS